jgi:hypothetical protein
VVLAISSCFANKAINIIVVGASIIVMTIMRIQITLKLSNFNFQKVAERQKIHLSSKTTQQTNLKP